MPTSATPSAPAASGSAIVLLDLKATRQALDVSRAGLCRVTGISTDRIRDLENTSRQCEPWFDEALAITRALGLPGILSLTVSGNLKDLPLDPPYPTDRDLWLSGARLPLSDACRVALSFGLSDPVDLDMPPLALQLWELIQRNERGALAHECPVCLAHRSDGHLPTCLGNNLFSRLGAGVASPLAAAIRPRPRAARVERSRASAIAHGLHHFRTQVATAKQSAMAEIMGLSTNYYARLERGDVPLPRAKAERLSRHFGVDADTFYMRPDQ